MTWAAGRRLRLRSLFARRDLTGRPDMPMLSVYRDYGVILRDGRDNNYNKPGEDLAAYRVVRRGDLVINKMKAWQGSLGISNYEGIVSPAYFVARPLTDDNPAFLHQLLRSRLLVAEYGARSKGIRPSQWDLPWDEFRDITVELPALSSQGAVARYLDRETAQLDALIAAKRRMVELLEERWQGFLESIIRDLAGRCGEAPLKYVCREIVVGIVITPSAWYAEAGIPAIRGTNVSPGSISSDDLVYLTPEGHALHQKSSLRTGDVVVVRTGQAGAAAVVPSAFAGANCIDLVIIRLGQRYSPYFLEFVLNSDWMQKHIEEFSVGTIQSHFNVGAAALVPIPLAPLTEQESAIAALRAERLRVNGLIDVLSRQVELLQERRQALITAAVSGQLDIPTAA